MPSAPPYRLLVIASAFYAPMLISAFFVEPRSLLTLGPDRAAWTRLGVALAIGLAAGAAVVLGSRWVARRTGWGRALRAEMGALTRGLGSREILAVSLLSGFGEELMFRGVLMHYSGVWMQGIVFAAFHFPIKRALWPWTGFALAIGLGLGELTVWCGSLWPAVLLHFCVNYFNLHDLAESPPAAAPPSGPPAAPGA